MFRKDVQHIEFSPNGESLFAGSKDGTANIWMIEKGKKISLSEEN
jgi:WD40 repeat protein